MLFIRPGVEIPEHELEFSAIRAQGSGGQNVNKVASAIHLRFDIRASSLPEAIKQRLLRSSDSRINKDGVIIIKAQQYRSQEMNRNDALARLQQFIQTLITPVKARRPTRPSRAAKLNRLQQKSQRGKLKRLRGKVRQDSD